MEKTNTAGGPKEKRLPERLRSAQGLDLSLGDLTLVATGTSERFHQHYTKESDAVERVEHVIAPALGDTGEGGEENLSKVAHLRQKSLPALPRRLPAGKGLVAQHDSIVVNEKRALGLPFPARQLLGGVASGAGSVGGSWLMSAAHARPAQ